MARDETCITTGLRPWALDFGLGEESLEERFIRL
jgi:hypothetical protein